MRRVGDDRARPPPPANRAAPSIFGPMLPGGNSPASRWRSASDDREADDRRAGRGVPNPSAARGDAGDEHEQVGAERGGELGGAAVLVDDGVDARRGPPARRTTGMPPPPPAITSTPRRREHLDLVAARRSRAGCGLGIIRRHPRPASGADLPAALVGQPPRRRLVVERADRLRRRRGERRVVGVDADAREDRRGRQRRVDARRAPAGAGSRSRPGSSRRGRRTAARGASGSPPACCSASAPTCGPLPWVSTTSCARATRAIAPRGLDRVRRLLGPGPALVLADQRVAAERDDDAHATRPSRQELRIASQIARAGRSDGLAHECG